MNTCKPEFLPHFREKKKKCPIQLSSYPHIHSPFFITNYYFFSFFIKKAVVVGTVDMWIRFLVETADFFSISLERRARGLWITPSGRQNLWIVWG
jgi:hypothetical protein